MRLNQTVKGYWRAFVLWRQQEKLRKQRERLEEGVRRRKAEAAKLGITNMLLDIYKNGHGYQPWISNYERRSIAETTFSVKGHSYTVTWKKFRLPFSDTAAETVTIRLQESDKELFTDSFEEDCNDFGLTYKINEHGHSITAYAPGPWVKDLRNALDAVVEQEKENALKEKHSRATLDDLKGRFGL